MRIADVALGGMKKYGTKLRDWLQESGPERPEIVTLQKIGLNQDFPEQELLEVGYKCRFLGNRSGRSPTGVAILSHRDLGRSKLLFCGLPGDKEKKSDFLTVDIGGLWVSSVYVPYNPKGRITWIDRLRAHVHSEGYQCVDSVLCGDFNVKFAADGPRGSGYTQAHEHALKELMNRGFCDLYRTAHPNPRKCPGHTCNFSEECPSRGSRLHLALGSKSLAKRPLCAWLDVDSRPRNDAPPLVIELDRREPVRGHR